MGKIAAIDYGLKRIGVAISDSQKKMALPLSTVAGGEAAIANLLQLLLPRKEEIELLVVGLPLLLNGKKGEMALKVEHFAKLLKEHLKIDYVLFDERFTSKQADVSLKEISMKRKKRSERIDCIAATFLLQSYLDQIS